MKKLTTFFAALFLAIAGLQAQNYSEADKEALRTFLRQPSSNGTWNGAVLGLSATDTTNWQTSDENWVTSVAGLTWDGNSPKRLTQISWPWMTYLAGTLDLGGCDSLTSLDCSSNQLSDLDVSGCTNLSELYCYSNQLSTLDVSTNTELTYLSCFSNQLNTLDVSSCTNLYSLNCFSNQLNTLDVSSCTNLTSLSCSDNQLSALALSTNTALIYLYCSSNQLSSLDVSSCTNLYSLDCSSNQLSALDVSGCTNLSYLDCYSNQLSTLDVSKNTALTSLNCYSNQLSTLDVSKNTALTYLYCYSNQLSTLDVSKNTALTSLNCYSNQLSTLDVSKNTALTSLNCYSNQLSTLDVSKNTALTELYCYFNQLNALDVGTNTALTSLNCSDNQLSALDVSKNTALTSLNCSSNQLSTLDVSKNTALTYLDCSYNQLNALNVSKNTALTYLDCYSNQLSDLNVSGCTNLSELYCYSNQLSALDVSKNTALTYLNCYSNQLSTLDVSKNTALTYLNCSYNQLSTLDVSKNTALTYLYCSYNQLSTLDVSGCTNLSYLSCSSNQLSTLDVSTNTALTELYCSENQLKFSTLPANTIINYYYSPQAELKKGKVSYSGGVDLSSEYSIGATPDTTVFTWYDAVDNTPINNLLITNNSGLITFDPSLSGKFLYCEMQNTAFQNLTLVCRVLVVANLSDEVFHAKDKEALRAFLRQPSSNGTWNGAVLGLSATDTANWQTDDENWVTFVAGLTWNNNSPKRLTGINWSRMMYLADTLDLGGCDSLTSLSCFDNQLSALDVSKNTALTELYCYFNQLSALNVGTNTVLTSLDCSFNQLSALDVSGCTNLSELYCSENQLSALDVSGCTNLSYLDCYSNQLSALNVSTNTALTSLNCSNNHLSLAILDTFSQRTGITNKSLGTQSLPLATVALNTAVAVDTVFHGNNTHFDVFKYDGTLAAENTDYSISGGEITFLTAGIYNVETTNTALISNNTAKVVNFYLAGTGLPVAKTIPFTEDFESGATGWILANGQQTNQWMIGNATAKSGSQAIYISDNGTDNHYNIGSESVAHFFCDVAFSPSATGYQLSFDWKGMGEVNWDDLKIFLTDTTELPFAGYTVNGSLLGTYGNATLWQQASVHIPVSYAGTVKRLVFSWRNDGGDGGNPPAAIDNIAVKNLDVVPASGISLNKHELSLKVNATETLMATVSPANATNKNVSWASRNEGIATVNASGLVTGKTAGTVYIVATTQDGGFKDSCLVTVTPETGIETPSAKENALVVYPNPTFGQLKVESGKLRIENIQVFDMVGKLVFETKQTSFNISHLPNGIYSVRLSTDNGVVVRKVVKE